MLLIQSDMLKALGYLVSPIVSIVQGPVQSSSAFCQVSGFLIALSIEASDFAILMIAVHAALYIFRPNTSVGEAGLYDYRYIAYACWIAYPVLMASVAFVNPVNAYIFQGTFCYLPVRPFWYRLALSWIPRYFIILTISSIYLAINLYVRYKFKDFDAGRKKSCQTPSDAPQTSILEKIPVTSTNDSTTVQSLPKQPKLSRHGLIESSMMESAGSPECRQNLTPSASAPTATEAVRRDTLSTPEWEHYTFGDTQPLPRITQHDGPYETNAYAHRSKLESKPPEDPDSQPTFITSATDNRIYNIFEALRDTHIPFAFPSQPASASTSTTPQTLFTPHTPTGGPTTDGAHDSLILDHQPPLEEPPSTTRSTLHQRHLSIKRQLRFLFIYPLVYILMWAIPFASHCLQYSDHYSQNPPFVLSCFVTVLLCLQCAVVCWLFSTREKPWRFVRSKGPCIGDRERKVVVVGEKRELGRRVGTMMAEAKAAKMRRGLEVEAERERERRGREKEKEKESARKESGEGAEKSWWDVEGRWKRDSVLLGAGSGVSGVSEEGLR
ncbi:hypothetical protein MMC24_000165 [Lignoscripta atroalba]|nr:hypothetical protein [Lignoscripta atroalba]